MIGRRGPFDRMLVARAISEPLHLLRRGAALRTYSNLVTLV
jgi:PIN domain nuclease of toxin-antitoxin system